MIAWLLGKVLSPEASLPEPVPPGVSVYRSRFIPVLGGLLLYDPNLLQNVTVATIAASGIT